MLLVFDGMQFAWILHTGVCVERSTKYTLPGSWLPGLLRVPQTNLETRVQIRVFPDGRRVETDAKTRTTVTLWPDGKQITVFDDKTQLTLYPDGRSHQVSPNGTTVTIAVDGTKEQKNPDGSSIVV